MTERLNNNFAIRLKQATEYAEHRTRQHTLAENAEKGEKFGYKKCKSCGGLFELEDVDDNSQCYNCKGI